MSDIKPPHPFLTLLEGRASIEAGGLMLALPVLRLQAPRGQGEPVMVLPGFMTDDRSTLILRNFLTQLGYQVTPWKLGINRRPMLEYLPPLHEKLNRLYEQTGQKVRLVGWSRGGILSRELARDNPAAVDRVITIGSPVKGGTSASSIGHLVRRQTGLSSATIQQLMRERNRNPIEVPIKAIYSRSDGIVAWKACIDKDSPDVEHFEVTGSHAGMGASIEVFRLVPKLLR